jgi:hypothetical protein
MTCFDLEQEFVDRPDKKYVVSIGYICGNLVFDIVSFQLTDSNGTRMMFSILIRVPGMFS